ncbi:MAG: xanthine dehydrogenase family protein subunit M [Chloroflexi bacterium]|nr:xanthine dehydrogenase family protein subunit M [Chloroflexota bacterium]
MNYELLQPDSLSGAMEALAQHGDEAKVLAGGTAVVLMLQQKLIAPTVLVSIGRVPDLDHIRTEPDGLHIGPLTILRDMERSSVIQRRFPLLAQACGEVGNVRIRNQATLGGNLAEADYASDPPTALLALGAQVTATSVRGARTIPLEDFLVGFYTTDLEPDELITDIFIPASTPGSRMTYLKYKSRSSEDRPCTGVAAIAAFGAKTCTDLRVAVGAACEVPQRLPAVESLARGQALTDELIGEIAAGYADSIETLEDIRGSARYRTQMIRVHVYRALEELRNGHR